MSERRPPRLSSGEIANLHNSFSDILKRRGQPRRLIGEFPANPGGEQPVQYRLHPSPNLVKETMYPREDLTVLRSTYLAYLTPHRIDRGHDASIFEPIFLAAQSDLGNGLKLEQSYYVDLTDELYSGLVVTRYYKNGSYVSPNNVTLGIGPPDSEERMREIVSDAISLNRDMNFDDAQKLSRLFRSL